MNNRRSSVQVIRGLTAALLAVVCLASTTARAIEEEFERNTITVIGTGRISALPDVAEINVGVVTQSSTAQDAMADNASITAGLHKTLKESGIPAKDIQTSQIQVSPQYNNQMSVGRGQNESVPRIIAYRVENTVQVTARQIDKLGPLLDSLVKGGANQIHSISFRVDHPEKLLDEAARRAVAEAKRKAELLAGEAGVVLGPPLRISEAGKSAPPISNFFAAAPMMAAPTPIAVGEQELSVSVQVVYELRQAK
jgi:uncharacterized protein